MSESGREGFRLATEGIFNFEDVGVVDSRGLVFLPGADQLFQCGVSFIVESFRLLAKGFVSLIEFCDRLGGFHTHAATVLSFPVAAPDDEGN